MQAHAVIINEFGGPDVMRFVDVELPAPAPGEARIRHTAIGLNFIDTYHRTGLYPIELPGGLGTEAAGVVEAAGASVADLAPGDRVVYTGAPLGAYADFRNYPAERLVPIPDGIDDATAAAVLLKGLTAWYLLHRSYPAKAGDTVLLYAAAGGVGSIATQWAKAIGADVIGVVGSDAKAERARSLGCDHVVLSDADIAGAVRDITGGEGVAAVYDSIGKDTFFKQLEDWNEQIHTTTPSAVLARHSSSGRVYLSPLGLMVSFGNASGPVEPFAPAELAKRGSLYVTRPVLFDFIDTRERLLAASKALFARVLDGSIVIDIGQRYPLDEVARAHADLEARRTTGSTILVP